MLVRKFVDIGEYRDLARSGDVAGVGVRAAVTTKAETVAGQSRTKRFVFSDATIDLSGDAIKQDGWQLSDFRKNPVALWSHNSSAPPIGRASNVAVVAGKLMGDIEFAPPDIYPLADTIFRLVDGGYIKAVSVGFMPIEFEFSKDKNRPNGINFLKQQLLEISVCSIPCNPNALIEPRAKKLPVPTIRSAKAPMNGWQRRRHALELQVETARMLIQAADDQWSLSCAYDRLRRYLPQLESMEQQDHRDAEIARGLREMRR
jgi:HK97 family phage prohead protease